MLSAFKLVFTYWVVFILTLIALCALGSCGTPHAIAERKLRKALRIDPSIIEIFNKDTTLYRLLNIPVVVTAPAVDVESNSFNCDSLKAAIARLRQAGNKGNDSGIYIYKDTSGTSIKVLSKGNGNLAVAFHVPPREIHDTVKVRDTLRITIPARVVKVEVKAPCYTYFWFWGLVAALVLETILFVRTGRQKGVVVNNHTTPETPTKP